ncbi:transposase [Acinetobacter bereziniae]|nr:transposase [Acinetobacter bereziniae]
MPEGEGIDWKVVIVDATKIPIQRPKKTEEKLLWQEKSAYFYVQAIVRCKTQRILSLLMSKGAVHDFELFKSNLDLVPSNSFIIANKGYQ